MTENVGLQITFDVNPQDYGAAYAQEYGIRVAVHSPGEFSYPQADGFTIAPGEITQINIKHEQQQRLQAPYNSSCMDQYPPIYELENLIFNDRYRYSLTACKMACIDYYLKTMCGCVDNK